MNENEPSKVLIFNPMRNFILWRLYEDLTIFISYSILPMWVIFSIDFAAPALGKTPMTGQYLYLFGYGSVIALVWTMIYDVALYALNKNEKNNPITKWLSLRCARFAQPEELLIVPHEGSNGLINGTKVRCEKCGVTHFFKANETESRRCPYRKFFQFCNALVTSPFK